MREGGQDRITTHHLELVLLALSLAIHWQLGQDLQVAVMQVVAVHLLLTVQEPWTTNTLTMYTCISNTNGYLHRSWWLWLFL